MDMATSQHYVLEKKLILGHGISNMPPATLATDIYALSKVKVAAVRLCIQQMNEQMQSFRRMGG